MDKMKKHLFLFGIFFILTLPVFAQTASELESLLNTNAVSYEHAARFVLLAADVEDLPWTEAFNFAAERDWLPKNVKAGDKATLQGLSLLVMEAFGLKGGFMYSQTRNPHYAYRELVYQDIIQGRADPDMDVSGYLLIFTVNRVLSGMENQQWR